jgi:hypothetical protein
LFVPKANRGKPLANEEVTGMPVDVKERKRLYRLVSRLHREDVEKVTSYAAFLMSIQDKEDREDMRIIEERADEPTVPWEVVKRELGL